MSAGHTTYPGRGAGSNPPNRFEKLIFERDPDAPPEEEPAPATVFFKDHTRSIVAYNASPDVGFDASVNPYRGCEHGCVYCYARPTHEYLGFSAGLDFETRILVKHDAPQLLRRELMAPRWTPQVIALSGVTDPYQPIERKLKITRGCLEVLAEFRNPIVVVTKNALVARDGDLLADLAEDHAAAVYISITTLDFELARVLEPRTSTPVSRLDTIRDLAADGIPVGVLMAPVIPGLTDHEMLAIIRAAGEAGACSAGFVPLRLPHAVEDLFVAWLDQHAPTKKEKVLNRIRELRGGRLNDSAFGSRMRGSGVWAEQMREQFKVACHKAGLRHARMDLSTAAFRRPGGQQLSLLPD